MAKVHQRVDGVGAIGAKRYGDGHRWMPAERLDDGPEGPEEECEGKPAQADQFAIAEGETCQGDRIDDQRD
jgi:hypothetical protein